jgi:hypothetical protein
MPVPMYSPMYSLCAPAPLRELSIERLDTVFSVIRSIL